MPATIFSGNNVKALKSNLDLNGVTKILSVNADPASGAGVAAPLGSIAMDYLAGKVYKKTGSLDTEWQELGSGIGGINYIENSDAESGTSGWSTYADAAGSAPVDGTGGTANITWNRRVPTPPLKPLRGVADFSLVKDAVNRQGQGVSYDFTIDSADQAKILTISADYEVLSGTFATGDLAVYIIQDPAGTPVVLQPAGYQVTAATIGNKVRLAATFQTASNVTSYRLCIHVASVSASAYTLAFDSIAVSPQQVVYGAPVTDWQSFTPTGSWTTNVTYTGRYRRVGDSMEVQAKVTCSGVPTATILTFNLPSGFSIDTSRLSGVPNPDDTPFGTTQINDASAQTLASGLVVYNNSTSVIPTALVTSGAFASQTAFSNVGLFPFGAGDSVSVSYRVPILGWSSSVVVSSSTDTRVVAARVFKTANQGPFSVETKLTGYTVDRDSHGMWDATNNRFNILVPGDYQLFIQTNGVPATTATQVSAYKINGGATVYLGADTSTTAAARTCGAAILPNLKAGDFVEIFQFTSANTTVQAGTSNTFASIARISGPSQIAASETVAARYTDTSGQAIGTSLGVFKFATRDYDTHGGMNTSTGIYTAPIGGKYSVDVSIFTQAISLSTTQALVLAVYKNGSLFSYLGQTNGNGAGVNWHIQGQTTVSLNAGDTIGVYISSSVAGAANTTAGTNHVAIERIGN